MLLEWERLKCMYLYTHISIFISIPISTYWQHEFTIMPWISTNTIWFIWPFTLSDLYFPSPVVRRLPFPYLQEFICSLFLYVDESQTLPGSRVTQKFPSVVSVPIRFHASVHQCLPWTDKVVLVHFFKLGIQNFFTFLIPHELLWRSWCQLLNLSPEKVHTSKSAQKLYIISRDSKIQFLFVCQYVHQ